jgi:histidyl-tRNA synthetase
LSALDLPSFVIKINDRRILNGLAELLGCSDKCKELDRAIDKVDSIGIAGVIQELMKTSDDPFARPLILSPEQCETLSAFLRIKADSSRELLKKVEVFFGEKSTEATKGIQAIRQICIKLWSLGISEVFWKIDLSVARGLDYYTGPVFETVVPDMPDVGSIFSGGRFDGLVNRFDAAINMPGVGASIGVDRLFTVLSRLGKIKEETSVSKVLVTVFDPTLSHISYLCADTIRKSGIPTEIYLGNEKTLKGQLGYALKQGIRFVVIIGSQEIQLNKITLKDLLLKQQELLTEVEAIARITAVLQ